MAGNVDGPWSFKADSPVAGRPLPSALGGLRSTLPSRSVCKSNQALPYVDHAHGALISCRNPPENPKMEYSRTKPIWAT